MNITADGAAYELLKADAPDLNNIASEVAARVQPLPASWVEQEVPAPFRSGVSRYRTKSGRRFVNVMLSISTMQDGSRWLHASVSATAGKRLVLPTWQEMVRVKEAFFGSDSWAVQVFPARAAYISIADCLHVWAPAGEVRDK